MEKKTEFLPAEAEKKAAISLKASSTAWPDGDPSLDLIIPGLPNDLAFLCLAFLPFSHYNRLKPTSKAWRSALSSKFLFDLRREWRRTEEFLCVFPSDPSLSTGALFDPRFLLWSLLPPMPCHPHRFDLSNFVCASAGSSLFVLGGSFFDARSYPLGVPLPSSAVFSLSLPDFSWQPRSPMLNGRAGFACATRPSADGRTCIFVAGGGSRHLELGVGGLRIGAVEWYDVEKDEWFAMDEQLPDVRAGCVGFFLGEDEFWVMGGYGDCRTVSGVFPVDDYYRDGAVLGLKRGQWRSIEPMWEEGERWRLGSIVVVEGECGEAPEIFMLEESTIFRFDKASNKWDIESPLPRKIQGDRSNGFTALDGELHVMSEMTTDLDLSRTQKGVPLFIQVYHPKKKTWKFLRTKSPVGNIDFRYTVMCSIRL
ncbi:F-box/kelch-repeat protein OR23 isoform X1 [Nymphaea colorata]|nr:F-box/kelch-repeat protein OR23 isoform X1 [Nymphaea colorata]